jgi:hypothetical protein
MDAQDKVTPEITPQERRKLLLAEYQENDVSTDIGVTLHRGGVERQENVSGCASRMSVNRIVVNDHAE